ncbi:MAG TPA: lysophospholipid acyltransferase family protein [Cyclobacteriaceae bacterium]|nr:lysophospholipid acyltransferase family protein [Cyclobacteriaceae bacterium]
MQEQKIVAEERSLYKKIKYFLLYWFVRSMLNISNFFPRRWWLAFTGWLGRVAFVLFPKFKKITIHHLGLAYKQEKSSKEIYDLAKQVFISVGKNAGDTFRSLKVKSLAQLEAFLVTTGIENFETAHARNKGVIFLTCHMGAFDMQITNMALRGLKPNIIGTPLKDPRLNELLVNYRSAFGAIAIARGKETFRLIKALKLGGTVAILIDQDTSVKGVFVDFFGMKAFTPIGAAVLALKTGAAVIPTIIYLGDDNKQRMEIFPEIQVTDTGNEEQDILNNTQAFTAFIESQVRKHPEQWVWMHERWKTQPA